MNNILSRIYNAWGSCKSGVLVDAGEGSLVLYRKTTSEVQVLMRTARMREQPSGRLESYLIKNTGAQ